MKTLLAKLNIFLGFCFVFMASIKFPELLQLQFEDADKTKDVSVEAIMQAFADLGWLSERNATLADIVRLTCYCLRVDDKDEEENEAQHAAMIALLVIVDEIHKREKAKAFPLVLTKHCDGIDSETADDAERTLQHCIKN